MKIGFSRANTEDAELLIKIYNASLKKCGFTLVSTERDGNVELARFVLDR